MSKLDYLKVKENFLTDTKDHTMTVKNDNGLYRHLSFSNNGSFNCQFDITTWPGFLCYSGDMGTFVFERTPDMFKFFGDKFDEKYSINPNYWSEKLQAVDGRQDASYDEYCSEIFSDNIKEDYDTWVADNDLDPEHQACIELWSAIENEVLLWSHEHEIRAFDAATAFEYDCDDLGKFTFQDFWERDNRQYKYRYIWSLHAIVWGIREYNRHVEKTSQKILSD